MIAETYSQVVFDELIQERYLKKGFSPSVDQTSAIMGVVAGKRLGLTGSLLEFAPPAESESSAKAIGEALTTFVREIMAIYAGTGTIKDLSRRIFDRAENQVSLINKQSADMALEACALAQGRQEGFNLFFWDNLVDLTKTDQAITSSELNPQARGVQLKTRPGIRRVDLGRLDDTSFEVQVIRGDVSSQTMAPDSRLRNAVDDSDSYWLHRLHSVTPGAKGLALLIDLEETTILSRITFAPFGADSENGITVRVLGSENGINWRELLPATLQTSPRVQINGSAVRARYLRIEMTRSVPSYRTTDSAGFVYEFGLNDLKVFEAYHYPTGQWASKLFQFKNVLGVVQRINRLRFDVYEEVPVGTEIVYYITTDPDSTEGLIRVIPGETVELNTVIENREDQGKVRSRYDTNHALIGLKMEDDFVPETVRLFRNTYQPGILIDGVAAGWKLKDSYYSCIFELEEELEVNLGVNFAFIDGKKVNGIQVLKAGFHTFRTHETNWRAATTEDADPLFPYNHKLIIEGLDDSHVYTGADFLAAQELSLISAFDLIENIPNDEDEYFGIYGSYPIVKIPRPPVFLDKVEGWRREQYAIRYKYPSDNLSDITSIRLIARMATMNSRLTPIFKGFIALAGF